MAQNTTNQNTNANNGYLIKNEKKNERQPDYRGKVTIDGKEWNLAVWAKGQRDGKDFFSLVASDPATAPASKNQSSQSYPSQNQQNQSGQNQGQGYQHSQSGQHPSHDHVVDDEFGSVFDGLP